MFCFGGISDVFKIGAYMKLFLELISFSLKRYNLCVVDALLFDKFLSSSHMCHWLVFFH